MKIFFLRTLLCFTFIIPTTFIFAQTFTVDNNGDGTDSSPGDGSCDDGVGNCTLRAAIEEANATAGTGAITIDFSNAMTIAPLTILPTLFRTNVSIDASTVAGASCGVLISGTTHTLQVILDGTNLVTATDDGLTISGTNSSVKGLVIQNFPDHGIFLSGDGATIACCYIGTNQAGTAAAANDDDGISLSGSTTGVSIENNLLSGNTGSGIHIGVTSTITATGNLIGTNVSGTAAIPNGTGISGFGSRNCVFGGTAATDRNLISGNSGDGFNGGGTGSINNTFHGNYIGLDITGEVDLGNGGDGIQMGNVNSGYTIGGAASGEGNVISGNGGNGIVLKDGTTVKGNFIGTDKDGDTDIGNDLAGINISTTANGNSIGGSTSSEGNIIAFNGGNGIETSGTADQGNAILRNSIFSNTGLGIDLSANGVTPNDADDPDTGPNNLQNTPVISNASEDGSNNVTVTFLVSSTTGNSAYPLTIQFFKTDADDEEGQTYLGEATYSSGEAGSSKTVVFAAAATVTSSDKIVATATDSDNNTSEFSASALLPVELISFYCEQRNQSIVISWETVSEINNRGFDMLRSHDAHFWEVLDFIAGHGTTLESHTYNCIDNDPYEGENYYRLKQIDYDGTLKFSNITGIVFDSYKSIEEMILFPNPAQESITFTHLDLLDKDFQCYVFNIGAKVFPIEFKEGAANITHLQTGLYFGQIEKDGHNFVFKFIKQ